jgi:hypothetical protein
VPGVALTNPEPGSAEASSWHATMWRGAAGVQPKARKDSPVARGEFPKVAGRSISLLHLVAGCLARSLGAETGTLGKTASWKRAYILYWPDPKSTCCESHKCLFWKAILGIPEVVKPHFENSHPII